MIVRIERGADCFFEGRCPSGQAPVGAWWMVGCFDKCILSGKDDGLFVEKVALLTQGQMR